MAYNSKIEWTMHTFNPWWGCVRVSPACEHCYAETFAKRVGEDVWGPKTSRRMLSDDYWSLPLKWNAEAAGAQMRARVFCASMADVFEDRRDLDAPRERLWALIEATPNLDWLLLTKRPNVARRLAPWGRSWPANVWMGTTVEDVRRAAERLPELAAIPAAVRFISAEPLLGPVSLGPWAEHIDWVITGGESGGHSRPSSPTWFRTLRDECGAVGKAFHFKQWGDWAPQSACPPGVVFSRARTRQVEDGTAMYRLGKKVAGRLLDGETWDGVPVPRF